ncbi:MAG: OmpA family protein [Candidatus Binatia bacterium]
MRLVKGWYGYAMGLAVSMGVMVPSAGWAQAGRGAKAAPKVETEIEEITVTAQKREENIQEVPISVTALTGEALSEKGATSVYDLTQSVPSLLVVASSNGASNFGMSLRGPTQNNPTLAQNSKMGLYVDGVYIAKLLGNNLDLEDLERVEVLRGPQGTLFGRNTLSGAVQLVTAKPTEDRSITASTEVGNFNAFKGRLTFNAPLIGKNGYWQSDVLGTINLRENVVYKHHDGYYDNRSPTSVPTSGGAGLSSLNRIFNWTAVRWQPAEAVTFDYAFEYHRYREAPTAFQLIKVIPLSLADARYRIPNTSIEINNPFLPGGLLPYIETNKVDAIGNNAILGKDLKNPARRFSDDGNNKMHLLTGTWDVGALGPVGNLTLKSINHFRQQFTVGDLDNDGSPNHIADFRRHGNVETWSTEEQVIGTLPRWHYVIGLYYYGEHTTQQDETVLFAGNVLNSNGFNSNWADSYAGFGQATWTPPILSDKLSLTGGIRYNQDHIHTSRWFTCNGPAASCRASPSFFHRAGADFGGSDAITYTGDASYQVTDEVMAYFRASRGWQSGYINADATDVRLMNVVDPEKLLTYELGVKSQMLDNRLRLNANLYFSDNTDQVVNTFRSSPTGGTQAVIENAGKSQYWGFEFEGTAIPVRGVVLNATYSYINAMFTEFLVQDYNAQGIPIFDANGQPVTTDVAGTRPVTLNPAHKVGGGITYTAPPTSAGVFSAHLDVYWQNDQVLFTQPLALNSGFRNIDGQAYAVVNGRLQFAEIPLQKGSLDLYAFGKNLFDKNYRTFGIDFGDSLGWQGATFGEPRTFGMGLTYNYNAGPVSPPAAPVAQAAPAPPPATPAKKKIVLRSVHFDFDKATLKAEAKPILDEAVRVLKQEGSVDIVVEGHTDSVGTEQYNLGLSRRRAETVRTYLVDHGIARSRITAEGLGEAKPVASNDSADGRAQNRRVELHVK